MTLTFLFVGGDRVDWLERFSNDYIEKIRRSFRAEIVRLNPPKADRSVHLQKRKSETELLLSKIKDTDFVVVFDERGESMTSEMFSKKMEAWFNRGRSRILFCVGGAFGFDDRLVDRADAKISLSKFVLNHHVAQAVVLEQVYRAIAIQKNLPYHNA